jgi:hypothetical protein
VGLMLQQAARDLFGARTVNVDAPDFLADGITIASDGTERLRERRAGQ